MNARSKLSLAQQQTGSILSIGLEPSAEYMPSRLPKTIAGYREFLQSIITATSGIACAYKFNLAFFESLPGGWDLLFEIREQLPQSALVIADAKRGDIGTTAKKYAFSLYELLNADSATVNPLMGSDSVLPFLEYTDKLTFVLCLTSNPGAADFILPHQLYRPIAEHGSKWNTQNQVGLVVGATRPEMLGEIRTLAPTLPFLIPGVGAQGGDLQQTLELSGQSTALPNIIHVTRGILPSTESDQDPIEEIRTKTHAYNQRIAQILNPTE
ncbi:MAG: orotidine-5'-phosphate decarboxylase [Sumerlaeia bacterium]